MLKIVMSKIEYSNFSKLIKLSDSIKSPPLILLGKCDELCELCLPQ